MSNSLYSLVICSHTQKHRRLTSRSLFLSPSKTPSSLRISCSRGLLASQTSTSIGKSCITRSKVDPWSYSRFLLETKSQMKSKQFRQIVKGFFPLRSANPGQDLSVSIMMLNPDGVARGYYRLDTMAVNLNRLYSNPSKTDNPTIWATRKAVI